MREFFWRYIIFRINFDLREVYSTSGLVDFSQIKINSQYDMTPEKYTHCVTYIYQGKIHMQCSKQLHQEGTSL